MSGSLDSTPREHDPFAALRQPKFVLYLVSRTSSGISNAMLQAILLWHVYELTGSALSLGILGLARFLPALGVSLIGGAMADTYNRRTIVMISQSAPLGCGVVLAAATIGDWVTPGLIYGLVLLIGFASSFEHPARLALLPAIVKPETFANAVTVNSTVQTFGMVTGFFIGGTLADLYLGVSYIVYTAFLVVAVITLGIVRYEQVDDGQKRSVSVAAIKEGIAFVRQRQVLYGAMSLDMFAVIFGGAKGLLPVYATDILHVGGFGYGLLFASLEIGAFLMSIVLVMRPPIYRTGRALIYTVAIFGLLTIIFGFSRSIYISVPVYMLIGAADQISVVMRNVIIQLATPDALRGRVSSVSQVFVQASNQVGAMESGFVAAVSSATFAVVSGGVAALTISAALGWRLRELYHYSTEAHTRHSRPAPRPAEEPAAAAGSG